MLLTTMNQDHLARLLAAEKRKGQLGIALTPLPSRSALVAALLSQSQGLSGPDAFLGGIEPLGLDIIEAMRKKRKKKRPQVLTVPQFEVDPSGLGLVRRR